MTKLIEFEATIVFVGDRGVVVRRHSGDEEGTPMLIATSVEEERACARRLYASVRVTVEMLDEEPVVP